MELQRQFDQTVSEHQNEVASLNLEKSTTLANLIAEK